MYDSADPVGPGGTRRDVTEIFNLGIGTQANGYSI